MHLPVVSWFMVVVLSRLAADSVLCQSTSGGDSSDTTTCRTRQLAEIGLHTTRLLGELQTTVLTMSQQMESIQQKILQLCEPEERPSKTDPGDGPRDCADLLAGGSTESGIYSVWLADTGKQVKVYCDMDTDGGGWLLFQRRQNGLVDFYRDWTSYKNGFGTLSGEFWLGNDILNTITSYRSYKLRFDLEDFDGSKRFAIYSSFAIGPECVGYRTRLGSYRGDAGDAFVNHAKAVFSTKDNDNDNGCANRHKGAWWYKRCHSCNLNGMYRRASYSTNADGVTWEKWHGNQYSLAKTEMKLRP